MKKILFLVVLSGLFNRGLSQTQISVGNQLNTFTSMIRGYHFTAPTNFTICGLEVPTTASNGLQTVRVVRFNAAAPPAFPGTTNNFIQLFSVTNQPNGIIPCNIPVTTGQIIGVYGVRGNCVNTYGQPNFVTSILGFPTTLSRSGMQSCPTGGQPMANIWSETFYNIGRIWMYINCCAAPTAVATNSGPICSGATLNLSANPTPAVPLAGVYTYSWTGPNGFTSNQQNPTIPNATVAASGTYTITINSNCGSVSATTQVTVNQTPTTTITNNTGTTIIDCNAPTINVTANGGTSYSWDNGLGTNANASITTAGTFTVTATNAQGCTNTASITTTVAPVPSITINDATICTGQTANLTAVTAPAGGTIAWNNGQTVSSISVNPMQSTTYSATYTWNGCSSADTALVTVNPTPTISVNSDTICNGDTIQLIATPDLPGGTYLWSNNQTTQTINVNPGLPGTTYSVTYTLTGCSAQASGTVTVNPVPVLSIAPLVMCYGETGTITAVPNLPGGTFLWSPGNQTTNSITVAPLVTTTYQAQYTLNNCLSNLANGLVTIKPLPVMDFSLDTTWGCIPLNVTISIDAPNPNTAYQWTSTNGFTGTGSLVQNLYVAGGCYSIFAVGTLNGCVDSASMLGAVCTEGFPTAEFSSNVAVFTESSQSVEFTNSSVGGVNYYWNFGDGENSTEFSPTHMFVGTQSGAEVTLTVSTAFGCSDSVKLTIGAQVGGLYYIPNAFTPDGDPFNPHFKPLFPVGFDPYNFNMLIYNRWGEVVFETNNLEVGWDGSYGTMGLDAPPGTYTYFINIKMPDIDKVARFVGHFTLIR
ncbi:MAG: gliding motility-associated C-terminal domain-containing protein [Bacteroidetes bacterium]|nr:gliding motility-associated C-terminal domain-containing protein [Bacteroidota bacterium]